MTDQREGEPVIAVPGFDIERVLSTGEHADVYLCRPQDSRPRAVLQVVRATADDAGSREHVASAARVVAALSAHPAIVAVLDAGVSDDGHPYLVVEHCPRPSPTDRSRRSPLPVSEVLQTIVRVAGAVETMHRAGVLHGGISPATLVTTDDGLPALGDVGLSVLVPRAGLRPHALPWASPETLLGRAVDERADVYSLAATAYTLLAGHPPFSETGADAAALAAMVGAGDLRPLSRADVPASVDRLLRTAMSADPRDRPRTASDLALGLQRIEHDMRLPVTRLDILPIAPRAEAAEDDLDSTVLSRPRSSPDDATVLGSRRAGPDPDDDATRLSARSTTDPDDYAARLSPRSTTGPGDDDATRLSTRTTTDPDDDATRLSPRTTTDPNDDATRLSPRTTTDPNDDATRLSPRRDPHGDAPAAAPQRPSAPVATRSAYTPPAAVDAYGVRGQQHSAEIVRSPVPPPSAAAAPGASARRRRPGGGVIVVCAVAVLVFGGAIGGIVALLTGSWGE